MSPRLSGQKGHNLFDPSDDVFVKTSQISRRNPVFQGRRRTNFLDLILRQVVCFHRESQNVADITGGFVGRIPLASDETGVLLMENRIEDWLAIKPRRKLPKTTRRNQIKLFLPHRPVKRRAFFGTHKEEVYLST